MKKNIDMHGFHSVEYSIKIKIKKTHFLIQKLTSIIQFCFLGISKSSGKQKNALYCFNMPWTHEVNRSRQNILFETQPMKGLYLERKYNIKQERLCDVVSQWLNCLILSNLPMLGPNCFSKCLIIDISIPHIHASKMINTRNNKENSRSLK